MAAQETELNTCQECGATIYPEHLERHTAERVGGRLLCPHCLQETRGAGKPAATDGVLTLADEPAGEAPPPPIRAFGGGRAAETDGKYRRALLSDGPNATRCRTFHCKLTDASMSHLDQQVNDWVDQHEGVVVKFATSAVGVVEGKHSDPHLIVTIFY